MALFTQFFPSAGDALTNNPGVQVGAIINTGFVITQPGGVGRTAILTGNTGFAVSTGDTVTFIQDGNTFIGTVVGNVGAGTPATITVSLLLAPPLLLTGAVLDVSFRNGFDVQFGGDLNVADNITAKNIVATDVITSPSFVGELTGNASTATALATAQDFSITGAITATAISFDGTAAVALASVITDDAITRDHINVNVAGTNLRQNADGSIELDPAVFGTGLTYDAGTNVVAVTAMRFNDTFAYTSTRTDNTQLPADIVAAFNDAGSDQTGIIVTAGDEYQAGDILVVAFNGGVETYLYIGANKTAGAGGAGDTLLTGDFVDITNDGVGGTVTGVNAGVGISVDNSDPTEPIVAANVDGVTILADGTNMRIGVVGVTNLGDNTITNTKLAGGAALTDLTLPIHSDTPDTFVNSALTQSAFTANPTVTVTGGLTVTPGATNAVVLSSGADANVSITTVGRATETDVSITATGADGTVSVNALETLIGTVGATQLTLGNAAGATVVSSTSITLPNVTGVGTVDKILQVSTAGVVTAVERGASVYAFDLHQDVGTAQTAIHNTVNQLPIITDDRILNITPGVTEGDSVKIANLSGVGAGSGNFRWTLAFGTQTVMGTTDTTLPLDDVTASFELYWTGATWLIIGAN